MFVSLWATLRKNSHFAAAVGPSFDELTLGTNLINLFFNLQGSLK
jgi:hypothetical protein